MEAKQWFKFGDHPAVQMEDRGGGQVVPVLEGTGDTVWQGAWIVWTGTRYAIRPEEPES